MQILPSAYASPNVSETRKNNLDKTGATVPDLFKDTITPQAQAPVASAVTGMTTPKIANDTIGPVVQQSQQTNEVLRGEKFRNQNQISVSDRKLLGAMTGYSVSKDGDFTDKNGKSGFPEDLTQHTLRSFMIALHGARDVGLVAGKDITANEFKKMMASVRGSVAGLGEPFNQDFLVKGLAYIEGRGKA